MKLNANTLPLTAAAIVGLGSTATNAFVPSTSIGATSTWATRTRTIVSFQPARSSRLMPLNMASDDSTDDEIERLRSMAAKLRAEASALGKLINF